MKPNRLRIGKWQLAMALLTLNVQFALASNVPLVSGSYEVVKDSGVGSQLQIQIRIHLVNHGSSDLSVQKITLWGQSHPDRGGTQACTVTLRPHGAVETIQQFTVRRSDYQLWKRGLRPRLVLQMAGPRGAKSATIVRLDPISSQEAK
jgi:hypothetical protein